MKRFIAALLAVSCLTVPAMAPAQAQQTQCVSNALAGGTVDAIVIPLQPCALSTNILILTLAGANTIAAPTLRMTGAGGALPIQTSSGGNPGIGALSGAGAVVLLTSTGSAWKIVSGNASTVFSGILTVPNGGTGVATITTNGVLVGQGTGALVATAAGTTGQYLSGNTSSPPTWRTLASGVVTTFSAGTTGFTPSSATGGAITLAGTLIPANGGTGLSSYAVGDLIYASASATLAKLAGVATGNALISGGVTTAPSWGKIGLTTHVSGTLPVANGGTGAASFTQYTLLYGNTTSAFGEVAVGTTGQILVGVTGGAPVFTSVPASGVSTIGFGTTGLTPSSAIGGVVTVAGTLAVANGGTGQTSYTNGQLLIGNTSGNTLTKASLTAGTGISITPGTGTITIAATASGPTTSTQTTNFAASALNIYCVDTTGGAVTATLPAAPANGDSIQFLDCKQRFATANLIIGRNSLTIMNLAENMTVSTNNANFSLKYVSDAGTTTWIIN